MWRTLVLTYHTPSHAQSTIVVSLRAKVKKLNALILDRCCGFDGKDHYAVDRKRNRIHNREGFKSFKQETNLPGFVTCVPGARVMHINNQYISQSISNGSCGFIVDVSESGLPEGLCIPGLGRVTDPYELNKMSTPYLLTASHYGAFIEASGPTIEYSTIDGVPCSQIQLRFQNAIASTVHETRGSLLDQIISNVDGSMCAQSEHACTALGRAQRWEQVRLISLCAEAFQLDDDAHLEYDTTA